MAGRLSAEIAKLYQSGETLDAVAHEIGDTISGVRKELIELGVKRRPRGHQVSCVPPEREELVLLVNGMHLSDPEIALQYEVSKRTVQRWRRDMNIGSAWAPTAPRPKR